MQSYACQVTLSGNVGSSRASLTAHGNGLLAQASIHYSAPASFPRFCSHLKRRSVCTAAVGPLDECSVRRRAFALGVLAAPILESFQFPIQPACAAGEPPDTTITNKVIKVGGQSI